jgi:hypothetical protein
MLPGKADGERSAFEGLYLVGVRLHADAAGSQLYREMKI